MLTPRWEAGEARGRCGNLHPSQLAGRVRRGGGRQARSGERGGLQQLRCRHRDGFGATLLPLLHFRHL